MKQRIIFAILFLTYSTIVFSQSGKLKLNLNDEGTTYVKARLRSQFWARYIDMNPGTQINGENVASNYDFSIRRIRVEIASQLTEKLYLTWDLAGNNLNQSTSKGYSLDVFNLTAEYTFHDAFALGFGKNAFLGFSRFNVFSSTTLLTLDAPLFLLPTANKNDHYGRNMGFWVKGQAGAFDYVLALRQPDQYGDEAIEKIVNYAKGRSRFQTSGYLKYQFFDMESNKSGYGYGSYLGAKKVLNIGVGFLNQPRMMWSLNEGDIVYHDYTNYAVELFFDSPLNDEKTKAITTVFGFYKSDFGPNYIRNVGANGYTTGGTSLNGSGHAFPMMGTGHTFLFELGYMFPILNRTKKQIIQPYYYLQYSDFEGLNDMVMVQDIGVNVFFKGHLNKMSLGYQLRPVFGAADKKVDEYKGMLVLQYQIAIN